MIRIGIIGYGNLGKGVELAVKQQEDMELIAIFSRRGKEGVRPVNQAVTVEHIDAIPDYQETIDVMILCGGSATDLPEQTPKYTQLFNTVDSFDNHSQIAQHYQTLDKIARDHHSVCVLSVGWDPGLFSLNRVLLEAILPQGMTHTFWGKGVSQGHSDALRRIEGVKDAVQYTIPVADAIAQVRQGVGAELTTQDKHLRECYVVAQDGADKQAIEEAIVTMPNYFADYKTVVHFIDENTLKHEHQELPHGGFVIRSGETTPHTQQLAEFSLTLDSNPEFTASVLVACARAAKSLADLDQFGAKTILDIPIRYLSPKSYDALLKEDI
ncbi:diaminopimelate dehydrogenase [Aerococcaceae bacterium DSM 111020]|nr:diaminopimelate dehydrogenase [Aerococcaceae bacterium DSM 111020]